MAFRGSTPLPHKPQLDGLRFVAFLLVFVYHAFGPQMEGGFEYGGMKGVQLFFVLSGFLITRILSENDSGSLRHDLRVFYARRFLRIFPLCYAVLLGYALGGQLSWAGWYFTYSYNIKCFLEQSFGDQGPSHFWSLCVEEQFYILYPLLLLTARPRWRPFVLVALLVLSKAWRFQWGPDLPKNEGFYYILLPGCGEYLLWGCLAGYVEIHGRRDRPGATGLFLLGLLLHAATLGAVHALPSPYHSFDYAQTANAVSFALIVFGLWRAQESFLVKTFSSAPLVYLGKISYGLYVYHLPVLYFVLPWLAKRIPERAWSAVPESWRDGDAFWAYSTGVWAFVLTVVISAGSWHFFESPINNLKRKFPYAHQRNGKLVKDTKQA